MALPVTPLPLVSELLINGTWTDVSSVVRVAGGAGVTITRGRADESSRVSPSRSSWRLDNRSGDYSNRKPTAAYFGLLGRGTQLRHRLRWLRDTFTRTVSNAWGTADSGQAWTVSGTASDYFTDGASGFHKHTNVNVLRTATLSPQAGAFDVIMSTSVGVVAAGAAITSWIAVGSDASNYYAATLLFTTTGNVQLVLQKRVAGALSVLVAATTVGTYVANTRYSVRIQVRNGGLVRAKAWLTSSSEPVAWTQSATDTSLSSFTTAVVQSRLETGNTNTLNVFVAFDNVEVNDYRFWGEVPAWPSQSDVSGNDVYIDLEAAGIMRRLGTGQPPLRSALYRSNVGIAAGDYVPYAYWPMEDGTSATQFASGLVGGRPLPFVGAQPGTSTGAPGSDVQPAFPAGSSSTAVIPAYASTGQWVIQFALKLDARPAANTTYIEVRSSKGKATRITLSYDIGSDVIQATAYDINGTQIFNSGIPIGGPFADITPENFFGSWYMYSISAGPDQSTPTDLSVNFVVSRPGYGTSLAGGIFPGEVSGVVNTVSILGADGLAVGHIAAFIDPAFDMFFDVAANANAMEGWAGETAGNRLIRLCREEGIYFELFGDASDTTLVGAQRLDTLLNNLFQAAEADQGILGEPRDALGLRYRTRASIYDQTGLALNYGAGHIAQFKPVEDDQNVLNDVTAQRDDGSSARVVVTDGPLGTDAIGTYSESQSWNVYSDDQLPGVAGWRARLGTWDEARFPTVGVNLAADAVGSSATLSGQVAAVDSGDYLSIASPPSYLPPDTIRLLAEGASEFLSVFDWMITWNCVPAGPWTVLEYGSTSSDASPPVGRYSPDSLKLHTTVNSSATSWQVDSTPLFTTSAAQFPQHVRIGGEVVTVTAVSGAANPQTWTVTRSFNGVIKGHDISNPAEVDITLEEALIYAP